MNQEKEKYCPSCVIRPSCPHSGSSDSYPSLSAFFRDVSARIMPRTEQLSIMVSTLELWYVNYRKGGFDAPFCLPGSDNGRPRKLDDALQEEIRHMKTNYRVCRPPPFTGSCRITAA